MSIKLHDLKPAPGSKKKSRRLGRGISAGQGKTSGRGTKGQNARTGGPVKPYFEGGQLPLVRRLPWRRGFNNINRVEYVPVNVERLCMFAANAEVTPEMLAAMGIIKDACSLIKVLGDGEVDRPLKVKAHRFSQTAREKIVAAGGEAVLIE